MKKTFVTCMVLVALFAIAGSAGAVTCSVDQRPAATLLVPWFQVTFNADGSPATTTTTNGTSLVPALDTIVTIGNASSAPTLAHVSVFNERSILVLDFNVALTGFDVQAMRMSEILRGNLPSTPITTSHVSAANDVCQRNASAAVYPVGFLRVRPASSAQTADPSDNTLATALYPVPAFTQGGNFQLQTLDSLDATPDSLGCPDTPDNVISGTIHGYITIDMANYCNLSNPSFAAYYREDAIGNENNLWGEVIYTSSTGLPTYGTSTVNIEADRSFGDNQTAGDGTQFPQSVVARTRTFYGRYWSPAGEVFCDNCVGAIPNNLALIAPWDAGFGDEREPLGLKYAARYFEGAGVSTQWVVWRSSTKDLTGSNCTAVEPIPSLVLFDEDENTATVSQTPLPSPLPPPTSSANIPLETQRISPLATFSAGAFPSGAVAGWASVEFRNLTDGTVLDQAWMTYEFEGPAAFLSASAPATQLDPSTCNPLGVPIGAFPGGVNGPVAPVIPGTYLGTATVGTPPTGTGPNQ